MANNNHLERVISLPEAAQRLSLSVEALKALVERGTIRGVQLPNGEIAVPEDEAQPTITKEQYEHLRDKPITVSEVIDRYSIPNQTIRDWVNRGYIKVIQPGYGMTLDEADVAYCAAVYYEQKKSGIRAPLFDEAGRPYQLKHPDLSEVRRRKKQTGPLRRQATIGRGRAATRVAKGKSGGPRR